MKIQLPQLKNFMPYVVGLLGCVVALAGAQASNYSPLVQRGSNGFNTKFAPTSPSLSIDSGDVTMSSVVGETFETQWRVFIPPGTKTLQITMYTFASPPESKVLMRFASPPNGNAGNVTPESAANVNISRVVQVLTANGGGAELPFYAPASAGAVKLSARSGDLAQTILTNTGGWLYINALQVPGDRIYELNTLVTVDEACYRSWFSGAQFDAVGNPLEDVVHTCAGSTGGTPLTGISLSGTSLIKGTNGTITITPQPSTASTGSCAPVYANGASNLVSISGGVIALADGSNSISSRQTVTIQCGTSVSTTITVEPTSVLLTGISLSENSLKKGSNDTIVISPTPSNASLPQCTVGNDFGSTSQVTVSGNVISNNAASASISANLTFTVSCGTQKATITLLAPLKVVEGGNANQLTLDIDLVPNASEVGSPGKVWIAARIPPSGFFFPTEMWFFKTAAEWKTVLLLPNPDSFKFAELAALSDRQVISVDLGLAKSELKAFGVEIFMGYRTNTGLFKSLGKVWP